MTVQFSWGSLSLIERIRRLRYILPPVLVVIVVLYQIGVAQPLEANYGHLIHYSVEIAFYSLAGPVVTLLTLVWVERRLVETEQLERQVQAQVRQLASLAAASADAILSLDGYNRVTSWNRGAERLLAYDEAAALALPLDRLLPEAKRLLERARSDEGIQGFETVALRADGRRLTVSLTMTAGGREAASGTLLIMRDVTARRERESILEEERARIARDLHDGVAQTLYFLSLKADSARQRLGENQKQFREDLAEISRQTRQVIREVRRTIFALRPLAWGAGEFWPALRRFVADFAEQAGWQFQIEIDNEARQMPVRLEPTVFRLVQESLNNVAKHAAAGWVVVQVRPADGDFLELKVTDDGLGFDTLSRDSRGLGLGQMESRVASVEGLFEIRSRPGEGTTVRALLPNRENGHG